MKKMVKWVLIAAVALMLVSCGGTDEKMKKEESDVIRIGVLQLLEHQALDESNRGFTDAVSAAKLAKPVEYLQQNAQGDQSNLKTIANSFVTQEVDLIAAISTPAAQAVANETQTIPIVGTAISDYVVAKLVESNEKPNTNVTGTSDYTSATQQLAFMREMLPEAQNIGIIYNSGEINSQLQADEMKEVVEKAGLNLVEVTVTNVNDIQQAARTLLGKVDVVYVPTDNVIASAMPTLIGITNSEKIPVVGAAGTMVQDGALASLSIDYYRLGYSAGEMAVRILNGEEPGDIAVTGQEDLGVLINSEQLKLLEIDLPASIKERAELQ